MTYDAQAQALSFLRLAVVFAHECNQTFGQADESDTERSLVDYALDGIVGSEVSAPFQRRDMSRGNCFTRAVFWKL